MEEPSNLVATWLLWGWGQMLLWVLGEWGHRGRQDGGGLSDIGRFPHQLRLTSCSCVADAWFCLCCAFGNGDVFPCGQAVLVLVKGCGPS